MFKKRNFALLLGTVLLLAACNGDEEAEEQDDHDNGDEETEEHDDHDGHDQDHDSSDVAMLEVEIDMPATATAGESVEIGAHVMYDGEDETEADQVEFEIKLDDESLDSIVAEHTENGMYLIEYTFEDAGEYEVIAHTDAHSLHTMPNQTIIIEE